MNQEKMDCMHSDIHGAGQILAHPFCTGEEFYLLHISVVLRYDPRPTRTGEVVGLERSPCEGWYKET